MSKHYFGLSAYQKFELKCPFCNLELLTTKTGMTNHIKACLLNPGHRSPKKHKVSEETRKKLSESLKRAYQEGRATGWSKRQAGTQSYPEKWFESIIKNEFSDQNYKSEFHIGKYRLDFAWPQKKRYIEIDGAQHKTDLKRQESDKEKDTFCKSQGWTPLRLSWSYIINNKQTAIQIAKDFIDTGAIVDINWESRQEKRAKQKQLLLAQNRVDSLGRVTSAIQSEEYWQHKKELILTCGVDLMKFGWRTQVVEKTGLSIRAVESTIKRFNIPTFKTSRAKKTVSVTQR